LPYARAADAIGFGGTGGAAATAQLEATDDFIHVERAGGPGGRAKIRLILGVEDAKGTVSLRLTADGEPIAGVDSEREARTAAKEKDYLNQDLVETEISPQELQPFIAALRKSETLNLATVDGKWKADISLHGAVAALLKMDEIQGRIGTKTALIGAGDKPRTAVPDAPALPVIVRAKMPRGVKANPALASMLRERIAKEDKAKECPGSEGYDCDGSPDNDLTDLVEALDRSRTLVGLICWNRNGVYNIFSEFWIVTAASVAKAVPVAFERPGSKETDNELINAEFDRRKGTLSFFYKGRGVGDYGTMGKYVWTGRSFALVDYAELGRPSAPPDYWPVLWRAKVK
jgi:hypothetical protein